MALFTAGTTQAHPGELTVEQLVVLGDKHAIHAVYMLHSYSNKVVKPDGTLTTTTVIDGVIPKTMLKDYIERKKSGNFAIFVDTAGVPIAYISTVANLGL